MRACIAKSSVTYSNFRAHTATPTGCMSRLYVYVAVINLGNEIELAFNSSSHAHNAKKYLLPPDSPFL